MADHPVVAVKKAIVSALQADTALTTAKLQRTYGYPQRPETEFIHTGKGEDQSNYAGAGLPRNHEVKVAVHVYTALKARGADEAEQRAWNLAEMTRTALAALLSTGDVFIRPDGITTAGDLLLTTPDGFAAEVTLEVTGLVRTST